MDDRDEERCCFDDWVGTWSGKARRRPTAAKVSGHLLAALEDAGLERRTVLDLGCGIGDLATATVRRGAASALGFDLSAKAIDEARRLAAERGVEDRTSFDVGDAAMTELPEADVVVLNRVVCCYPGIDALLERSLGAARRVFALTAPVSTGPVGVFNRLSTSIANAWYALRRRTYGGFRTFVHDVDEIDRRVREAGFEPARREHRRIVWDLAVYVR